MPRIFLAPICVILFTIQMCQAAAAQGRVALIIGNSGYQSVTPLANPANDAHAAAEMFANLGFETEIALDAGHEEMRQLLTEFRGLSAGAEVAVIYFAGHGIQAEQENFLLGVDADGDTLQSIRETAVPMQELMNAFAPDVGTKLLFLDACRNNPFAEAERALSGGDAVRGLARANHRVNDLLLVYAAQPNQAALDGQGDNSPFMQAMMQAMSSGTPDVKLGDALVEITNRVRTETRDRQVPYIEGSLSQHVSFRPQRARPNRSKTGCKGSATALTFPANTPENFTELPGRDGAIVVNDLVRICIKQDRVEISGPFEAEFPCDSFLNEEGVGYYYADTSGADWHIWMYADPANSKPQLELGVYRGGEELQWIVTNRRVCR